MKKDLTTIDDLTRAEVEHLIALGKRLKALLRKREAHEWLSGLTLAMIFEKPSLRTRVTFETGMSQLGGTAIYLSPRDIQLGTREPVRDIASNLSLWTDAIMARTFAHETITELAEHASVPVINGLSDLFHPCQVLADCMTLSERFEDLSPLRIVFVGDGNNMVHSWLLAASKLELDFTLVCPPGYEPDAEIVKMAEAGDPRSLRITNDMVEGTKNADVLYTDVWTSMGQEEESQQRLRDFAPYQINSQVMDRANEGAIVMHCLPAHRGEEITAEVVDGPQSIMLPQAENRLHIQKAVLAWLLGAPEARSVHQ